MSSVLIISDSSLVCDALRRGLADEFQSVKAASSIEQVKDVADLNSHIIICDVFDPTHVVEKLVSLPSTVDLSRWVLLLHSTQDLKHFQNLMGMVGAILPSQSSVSDVVLAARLMGQGLVVVPSEMLSKSALAASKTTNHSADYRSLTDREQEVLSLIAEGRSNKAIARQLDLSESTVRVHVRSLLRKLKLQNRTQAALVAAQYA